MTTPPGYALLRPDERAVTERVLEEEGRRRTHVVVAISGAHAYGFPSPDSDLDIKGLHVARTLDLLRFQPAPAHADRLGWEDGLEIDYTSNELGPVLLGVLKGNGNYLERILGPNTLVAGDLWPELADLARRALSRRVQPSYRGFSASRLKALDAKPTAKNLLYVLRTALTGLHLLRTGEVVTDLNRLAPEHGVEGTAELVQRKRLGEKQVLDDTTLDAWRGRVHDLLERLDGAIDTSVLPADPPNAAECEAWLLDVRRRMLGTAP